MDSLIRWVPGTLFFTGGKAWLNGNLFKDGIALGQANTEEFLPEEIEQLNAIVYNAALRHNMKINNIRIEDTLAMQQVQQGLLQEPEA